MRLRSKMALGMLLALLLAGAGTAGALLAVSANSSKGDSRIAPNASANSSQSLAAWGEPDSHFIDWSPLFSHETRLMMAETGADFGYRGGAAHLGTRGPRHLVRRIAEALGTTAEDLVAQIRAGNTLAQIIANKGSNPDAVFDTLTADVKKKLAVEVSTGNITQPQADLRFGILRGKYTRLINSHHPAQLIQSQVGQHHQRQHQGAAAGRRGAVILGVSKALNLNVNDLLAELGADKPLAQIIKGHGGKVADVLDFLAAGERAKLSTEVAQGLITQQQADRRLANHRERMLEQLQPHWTVAIGR